MKQTQEQRIKMHAACLQNIRDREPDAIQKQRLINCIKKLPDTRQLTNLKDTHKLLFNLLLDGIQSVRDAYIELTSKQFKEFVDEHFQINVYLTKLIPNVEIPVEKRTPSDAVSKIHVLILRDFGKICKKFPKQFQRTWRELSQEKVTARIKKKEQQKMASEPAPLKKVQSQKEIQPPEEPYNQEQQSQESRTPPPPKPKEKTQQQKLKQARQQERERQRQRQRDQQNEKQRTVLRENEERKRAEERRQRQQNLKKSDARQKDHFRSAKAKVIEKYIDSRKDLACQRGKSKEVGEYLAAKLDQFLKTSLEQMYQIACLKNKKNPKFGNELGYFAQENKRVQNYQQFYFQPNTKIYSLSYKHKHQIYCNLRIKEIKKEDELRYALEVKTNQGEKKIDKKIQNYILKPRPKESDAILTPFRQQKDGGGYRSQSVVVSLEHVIYFLENHPWLKNSLLLFNVYHRF